MQVIDTIAGIREAYRYWRKPVGFVPTMGYLHPGHLSLVRYSKAANATTVASIFVNPTQFGPNEDFTTYPRDTEHDLSLLREAGTDCVFMPQPEEMYPADANTWVDVHGLTEPLEGASRPGHFRGVTTVVAKLFNIVCPDNAYFGQKDAQQLAVIRKMVRDLDMPLNIVPCPTVREPDGLAMSSRNTYLNDEEHRAALVLSKSLHMARQRYNGGDRDADGIRKDMIAMISAEPLAKIDYISIADNLTLQEIDTITGETLVSMAVRIGKTRLIDNAVLG